MIDLDQALERLPHGPGFRFITRVTELIPGQEGRGIWVLTGGEWFLADHFPGRPLAPGVLLTESLAQLAGLVAFGGVGASADDEAPAPGMLASADMRYHHPVAPPATIELTVTVERKLGRLCLVRAQAVCEGRPVVSGSLAVAAGDAGAKP